ncbi:MAG: fatty acid desaturase, partial [Pseudomonadota bacterium]
MTKRDYGLTGPGAASAAQFDHWYSCPVPRKRLKSLVKRSDVPGLISNGIWLALLAAAAVLAIVAWGTWYAVPAILFYGVVYASCADSRWHECAHGTCFRTRWLNEGLYHLASFMSLKEPYTWRWSHTRHHTHTIVVGRDPE